MVLICTTTALYAQTPTQFFEIFPGDINRQFKFILDRGESMRLELMQIEDLQLLPNLDSLVAMVVRDLPQLTDTSEQVTHGRRLDYMILDSQNHVRLRTGADRNEYFASGNGQVRSLKMDEDTVMITGVTKPGRPMRFYRLSFYLNHLQNLGSYKGQLQQKVRLLMQPQNEKWLRAEEGNYYLKDNPAITAPAPAGKFGGSGLLLFVPSVDIQNYRDRFVPSITVGLAKVTRRHNVYQEYGLFSEAHFRFAKTNGTDKIFVQSFLTLSYGRGKIADNMKIPIKLFPYVSVSYLVKSRGDFYEKNTFRLGVGRFSNNSLKIEPALYMNGLFENITPSLRVVQIF